MNSYVNDGFDPDAYMKATKALCIIFILLILLANGLLIVKSVRKLDFMHKPKTLTILSLAIGDVLLALFPMVVRTKDLFGDYHYTFIGMSCSMFKSVFVYLPYLMTFVYSIGLMVLGFEIIQSHNNSLANKNTQIIYSLAYSSLPWILGLIIVLPLGMTNYDDDTCLSSQNMGQWRALVIIGIILPACGAVVTSIFVKHRTSQTLTIPAQGLVVSTSQATAFSSLTSSPDGVIPVNHGQASMNVPTPATQGQYPYHPFQQPLVYNQPPQQQPHVYYQPPEQQQPQVYYQPPQQQQKPQVYYQPPQQQLQVYYQPPQQQPQVYYQPPQQPQVYYQPPKQPQVYYQPPQQPQVYYQPPKQPQVYYQPPKQPQVYYQPPQKPQVYYQPPQKPQVYYQPPKQPQVYYQPPKQPQVYYQPPQQPYPSPDQMQYDNPIYYPGNVQASTSQTGVVITPATVTSTTTPKVNRLLAISVVNFFLVVPFAILFLSYVLNLDAVILTFVSSIAVGDCVIWLSILRSVITPLMMYGYSDN